MESKENVVVGVYYKYPRQNDSTDELFYRQEKYLHQLPLSVWEISASQTSAGNTMLM